MGKRCEFFERNRTEFPDENFAQWIQNAAFQLGTLSIFLLTFKNFQHLRVVNIGINMRRKIYFVDRQPHKPASVVQQIQVRIFNARKYFFISKKVYPRIPADFSRKHYRSSRM